MLKPQLAMKRDEVLASRSRDLNAFTFCPQNEVTAPLRPHVTAKVEPGWAIPELQPQSQRLRMSRHATKDFHFFEAPQTNKLTRRWRQEGEREREQENRNLTSQTIEQGCCLATEHNFSFARLVAQPNASISRKMPRRNSTQFLAAITSLSIVLSSPNQ